MSQEEKGEKESANNVTGYVVYNELFIPKKSNQEHSREMFIADSGATPHMVNSE